VDRRCQTLLDVENPPQTQDTQPLESLINSLEQAQKKFNEMKAKKKVLSEQVQMVVEELERWAKSNPVCPTCGAATDAQRLLNLKRGGSCHG
jgi:hypothetical protein